MIRIEQPLDINTGLIDGECVFDIETTGLSAKTSKIYLLGCIHLVSGKPVLTQLFLERTDSYRNFLIEVSKFMSKFSTYVSYNGDSFDIPYLNNTFNDNKIPFQMPKKLSLDIYKHVKRLIPEKLPSYKLTEVEKHYGIVRKYDMNGRECIQLYKIYVDTNDEKLLKVLLNHNAYDLENLGIIYGKESNNLALFKPKTLTLFNSRFYIDFLSHAEGIVSMQLNSLDSTDDVHFRDQDIILSLESNVMELEFFTRKMTDGKDIFQVCDDYPILRNRTLLASNVPKIIEKKLSSANL